METAGRFWCEGPWWQDRHLGNQLPPEGFRPEQKISGHRANLRRSTRLVCAQVIRERAPIFIVDGPGICGRANGWDGNSKPIESFPRRLLEEPERCRVPRSDSLAQGRGGQIQLV